MTRAFDTTALDELGRSALGLVTHWQLRTCSLTDAQIQRMVQAGEVIRVRRGVYRLAGAPVLPEHPLLAACLAGGPGVFGSHGSAGELWGLWGAYEDRGVEVLAIGSHRVQLTGVRCHRLFELPDWQRRMRGALPLTSPARTVCDLASRVTPHVLERMVDRGIRDRLFTAPELQRCLDFLAGTRRRGLRPLRDLMEVRTAGYDPGDSEGEARVLRVCREVGIPAPEQRVHLDVDGKDLFPDGYWSFEQVALEYDGAAHAQTTVKRRDREKIALYASAGILPLAFTDEDSDRYIGERVAETLAARRTLAERGDLPPLRARRLR